jgi:hypothetical protein
MLLYTSGCSAIVIVSFPGCYCACFRANCVFPGQLVWLQGNYCMFLLLSSYVWFLGSSSVLPGRLESGFR